MKLNTYKLALFVPVVLVALVLTGCDQNAFDENLGIPSGDGTPYVEFASNPDTLAYFKGETAELAVDNTTSSNDSIIVDWAISGGDAVLNQDFSVPASISGGGNQSIEQEIRIDPNDPRALDPDNLPSNIEITDTTSAGIILAIRTLDTSQRFETTFDETNRTGQVRIQANQFENSVNTGTIAIVGAGNASRTQPRSVVVELTGAQTGDGGEVLAGRRATGPDGSPSVVQNVTTVLFGQADVFAEGPVQFGEVPAQNDPYQDTFLVYNLGPNLGFDADIPTTLSGFGIAGSDAFSIAAYRILEFNPDGSVSLVQGFQALGNSITLEPNQAAQFVVAFDADEPATDLATFQASVDRDFDVRSIAVDFSGIVLE